MDTDLRGNMDTDLRGIIYIKINESRYDFNTLKTTNDAGEIQEVKDELQHIL